ncbi:MAG: HAD-IIA family hydrolase [Clostridiaceae bacterium]|nr:HAD-IIA family hydrolase [Clostridiaceae bacterium]
MQMDKKIDEKTIARLAKVRCWLLDMDGTVSLEDDALPGAAEFFSAIAGSQFIFLTNNSSRHADYYVARMKRLGFDVDRSRMLTSTDALILYLRNIGMQRLYAVGTPDFERALLEAGFDLIRKREEQTDMVVIGFDTTLTYEKVDIACDLIRSGTPWAGANPDYVCPLVGGKVLPDCGSIMAMIRACTDTEPQIVIGKPETAMVDMVIADRGYTREELAMVGDRLYTDLELAKRADILGIAVLTGETDMEEIAHSETKPDLILDDIGQLAKLIDDLK